MDFPTVPVVELARIRQLRDLRGASRSLKIKKETTHGIVC